MKEKILKITLLLLGIFITIIAFFIMPNVADIMAESLTRFSFLKIPGLVLIFLSLIPFYICIYHGWKLVDLVYGQEIFSEKAIKSLKIIRSSTFAIFVIYAAALLILILLRVPFTTAYLAITILALAGLAFSLTMSLVIRLVNIAKAYKDENELTI